MDLQKDYGLYVTFIKMCEVKNYSKVAQLLHYNSPQTPKDQMKALAHQVGVKTLFNGHTRGSEPTSEALELLKRIKPLIEALDFAERDFKDFNEKSDATIRMIIPATMAGVTLGEFFSNFRKKYPNIKFKFYNRADKESYTLVTQSKVDLVIDLEESGKNYDLQTSELFVSRFSFFASKHFLAENKVTETITTKDLQRLPLLCHHAYYDRLIQETGLAFKPFIITATLEPIYPLIEQGAGIGVYHNDLFEKQKRDDSVVPVTVQGINLPSTKIVIGHNKKALTKAARVFKEELTQFCNQKN